MNHNNRFPEDPNAQREHDKYETPIPSREYILAQLDDQQTFLSVDEIAQHIGVESPPDKVALKRRLQAMKRDGQLVMNRRGRYRINQQVDLVRGKVQAFRDGHGFLICEDTPDIYLSAYQMRSVMHGDELLVNVIDRKSGTNPEGVVVDILQRALQTAVGRLHAADTHYYVNVSQKRCFVEIIVPADARNGALDGQIVEIAIETYPTQQQAARGRVIHILGDYLSPGMEVEIAKRAYQIPHIWDEAVVASLHDFPDSVQPTDHTGRVDHRHLPFVTIDGEDAKDFDDAVYCEAKEDGGWRLYVAIADVSYYVAAKTALDDAAKMRGNSVYFPNATLPMLPEVLSNGLCSLKPHVDRLAFVCEMDCTATGDIVSSEFYESIIHSHARLTYTQVANIIEGDDVVAIAEHTALLPPLMTLYALYEQLDKAKQRRGCVTFSSTETRLLFDEHSKIAAVRPVTRRVSHDMIESFMLAANTAAATLAQQYKLPILYRNHLPPVVEKIDDFRRFIAEFKLNLAGGDNPTPKDFAQLADSMADNDERHLIETVMLRTMSQAEYQKANAGHFGLALPAYTHFTSPIRRYPDLHLHRVLKGHLKPGAAQITDDLAALGQHCSLTERRADDATRDVVWWLKCEYMSTKVGQTFNGLVTSVTNFGLFVQLNDIFVEGLVHVSGLNHDYYHYDAQKHCLIGERGSCYRLGDSLTIRVVRVDMEDKKIDFELVNRDAQQASGDGPKRKKSKPKTRSRQRKRRSSE